MLGCTEEPNLKDPTKKKFIIFGLPSSGKTSIIYFFKLGYLITTVRTLFINEESFSVKIKTDKNTLGERNYEVTFFEVGTDCSYSLIKEYADISNDMIYIVDSTHRSALSEAREEFIRIIYDFRFVYRKCKFLIFMNKQDSNGCLPSDEIINYFALPKELHFRCKFFSCSTLSGQGLKEGLEWLVSTNVFFDTNDDAVERSERTFYNY
ncbi:ADP-ribosylation factor, putative [Plasmodium knowlesi strain H]|uniref:ADP-ribosylation factor, putative n=3 Tax=Plasmodium knowlesi TaxID=5850 RepID=A0A5E7X6Q1_PLAKH|nr:ADP-ribosylation factor, putative [Plasmodium knowlesi strain H]OTN64203.1 putative ADP-ribosylation factor [Plasmodium knowlesi]CAA9990769.1 ADP-ribosylation factor, putative [Plasmodium knowlesi strain H]SBO21112.1 ADP-ribosylation factor, putative [Plasmodium knowlesi strain H]SBO21585.1 ADP-ribosylation factor, putative [Plasmodium knowlesi strain H]VVS80243.1 ADP-ribosylation factor, putative [Plasmodium knowlesi strain H]